jgi:hypothetical protein
MMVKISMTLMEMIVQLVLLVKAIEGYPAPKHLRLPIQRPETIMSCTWVARVRKTPYTESRDES